jgi:hypothetical protein
MGTRRSVHGWAGTVISLLPTRLNLLSVEVQLSKRTRPFKFREGVLPDPRLFENLNVPMHTSMLSVT